jgi:hypothetical protein
MDVPIEGSQQIRCAGSWMTPDLTVPMQFYEVWHRPRATSPERELALSVLWQAAIDLQKGRDSRQRKRQRLHREAFKWVASNDRTWPFSFLNLCDVLNLSPDYLRAELLASPASPAPGVNQAA